MPDPSKFYGKGKSNDKGSDDDDDDEASDESDDSDSDGEGDDSDASSSSGDEESDAEEDHTGKSSKVRCVFLPPPTELGRYCFRLLFVCLSVNNFLTTILVVE